ncbi:MULTISPECIES: hypothetical protein [Serratia]|uniref:hypothetical protein n=1 Tax=Serratia TaxID=613 RepID=UPI001F4F57FE|nr:hypothetical protein [Serratia oryzae]
MTISKAVSIATERENRKRETMKSMHIPSSTHQNRPNSGIARLLTIFTLLLVSVPSSKAVDIITIGKGSGIVWEGYPFSANLSGSIADTRLFNIYGIAAISDSPNVCMDTSKLEEIGGYMALPIAIGVGLIPRATISATYPLTPSNTQETLTGTIGLPRTEGRTSSGFVITNPTTSTLFTSRQWCLPPRQNDVAYFYRNGFLRTAQLSGTWVMVANGRQSSQQIIIPAMYAASFQAAHAGADRSQQILPSAITLRISTLECTIATTTNINFGGVQRNTQVGSELARLSYPLTVACSQDTDKINANINVQFRAASGQYEGTPTRLALTQGGGYITGEIDNGVTGSGACNLTTGIPFDNTQLKVGSISSVEATKVTNNQITWRLCSGGATLPLGPVDASTDMLVTFN